ncbi:c-type cytochrome [Undibacterium danionis]|uniref:C-type cytochrome n=1 Tax=Undibacterium danionis TaxID=1812100 RepID=A0ABV6IC88_9BURK
MLSPLTFMRQTSLLGLMNILFLCAAMAQEPVLELKTGDKTQHWTRSELLARAKEIDIAKDSAYQRSMRYRAVSIAQLLPQAEKYSSVQFVASDGFVANISGSDLAGKGQAYLAIEPEDQRWPAINPDNPAKTVSAGPFYLVWLTPEAGKISGEQWPYQVAKISVEAPLPERYPQIIPLAGIGASHQQAIRGMHIYIKNCAVCHTMNGGGDATIGPDLNLPFNPTEYFQEKFLRQLIRQPASVRSWKQSLMPSFDEKTISAADLDDLISYFKRMRQIRQKIPSTASSPANKP